ncbi:MAG: RICIN domain-containing protein [Oscillospiraceae bacterium]|nr:RICIN domain-containing protein [Oscillospiraceae bacterium]
MRKQKKIIALILALTMLATIMPIHGMALNSIDPALDITIDLSIVHEYYSGFGMNITMTNNGPSVLEDWHLGFDFMGSGEIHNFTSAVKLDEYSSGNHYVVKSEGWNGDIAPGASRTIYIEQWHGGNGIFDLDNIVAGTLNADPAPTPEETLPPTATPTPEVTQEPVPTPEIHDIWSGDFDYSVNGSHYEYGSPASGSSGGTNYRYMGFDLSNPSVTWKTLTLEFEGNIGNSLPDGNKKLIRLYDFDLLGADGSPLGGDLGGVSQTVYIDLHQYTDLVISDNNLAHFHKNGNLGPNGQGILTRIFLTNVLPGMDEQPEFDLIYTDAFPDDNFRGFVLEEIIGNGRQEDDEVTIADQETMAVVTSLDVSSQNIDDLTGIEYFIGLETLDCSGNNLEYLELGEAPGLTSLDCSGNAIEYLDIFDNAGLEALNCSQNELVELDLSENIALETLDCSKNEILELELEENTGLISLVCNDNELVELELSKNLALTALVCYNNWMGEYPAISVLGEISLLASPATFPTSGAFVYFPQYEDEDDDDPDEPEDPSGTAEPAMTPHPTPAPGSLGSEEMPIPIDSEDGANGLDQMINGNPHHYYELTDSFTVSEPIGGGPARGILNGNGETITLAIAVTPKPPKVTPTPGPSGDPSVTPTPVPPVADGVYYIENLNSGLVMDIYGGLTDEGNQIIQYNNHDKHQNSGHLNLRWQLMYLDNGYYKIESVKTAYESKDMALTLDGTVLRINTYTGTYEQQWKIILNGDSTYRLVSRAGENDNLAAETEYASMDDWAYIVASPFDNDAHQKWVLEEVSSSYSRGFGLDEIQPFFSSLFGQASKALAPEPSPGANLMSLSGSAKGPSSLLSSAIGSGGAAMMSASIPPEGVTYTGPAPINHAENFEVRNVNITGEVNAPMSSNVSGLIGVVDSRMTYTHNGDTYNTNFGVVLRNITSTVKVTGKNNVGGLIGSVRINEGGTEDPSDPSARLPDIEIENCTITDSGDPDDGDGTVTGKSRVGGIIGGVSGKDIITDIDGCTIESNVTGTGNYVGGIVGQLRNGRLVIRDDGDVDYFNSETYLLNNRVSGIISSNGSYVGGFVGSAKKYNNIRALGIVIGNISGKNYIGGIIGRGWLTNADNCKVFRCISSCVNCTGTCVPGNATITGRNYVGGIIGRLVNCKLPGDDDILEYAQIIYDNCEVWADISYYGNSANNHVGGFIGHAGSANYPGHSGHRVLEIDPNPYDRDDGDMWCVIEDSSFVGSIRGKNNVGGIMGRGWLDVEDCSVEANITASGNYIGGIVGRVNAKRDARHTITGTHSNFNHTFRGNIGGKESRVGGIAGFTKVSTIDSCSSEGMTIEGNNYVGGIVGFAAFGGNTPNTNPVQVIGCQSEFDLIKGRDFVGGISGSGGEISASSSLHNRIWKQKIFNGDIYDGRNYIGRVSGRIRDYGHTNTANPAMLLYSGANDPDGPGGVVVIPGMAKHGI